MDSFFMKIPKFWPLLSKIPKKFPNISFTIWRQNPNMFTSRKTWESIVSKHILKFTKCDDFNLNTGVWKIFLQNWSIFIKIPKILVIFAQNSTFRIFVKNDFVFSDVTSKNVVYIVIIYRAKPYIQWIYRLNSHS